MIHLDQPDLKTIEHAAQQMHDCISFAQGALRIGGVDEAIKEKTRELLHTDNADYYSHSLGLSALRNDLAHWLSHRYHASITHKNVIVSHGSINGIAALCLLLLDAGDEVLLPE
ncbi:MAG TPA: aminotransferase class I/II-fold pyridoxal phosphate-dependent enzyme, partial [Candidatus Babeliales bacterium]|nr:aminotransferase class I/II-fold pyridoxal phosphate-dependent enzyme [Candidatus Babeliales bacterium]